jgi:hypothetical protein
MAMRATLRWPHAVDWVVPESDVDSNPEPG